MSVARIAGRYAKSLLDLSRESGKLDRIREDMAGFAQAVKVAELSRVLKSPIINTGKKRAVLTSLFEGKVDELTMTFLNVILTKGREKFLPEIASAFEDQYRELKGITQVKLITATEISPELVDKIKSKLEQSSETYNTIEIETAVNPDLIGGFVFEFGDKLYDASVAHRLDELKKELVNK